MLLNFSITNYKSFTKQATLQMTPAPKQKDLAYSILTKEVKSKKIEALSSSVIYGPNAAGKSNIIGAIEVLQSLVSRGHIKNVDDYLGHNYANNSLELIPNNKLTEVTPVDFSIEFIVHDMKVKYELSIELGLFLDVDYERKIVLENLFIHDDVVFKRNFNEIEINDKFSFMTSKKSSSIKTDFIKKMVQQSLTKEELFLSNGFKNIVNNDLASQIIGWFNKNLDIIYRADSLTITKTLQEGMRTSKDKNMTDLAHAFGVCSDEVVFHSNDKGESAWLASVILNQKDKKRYVLPAEIIESYGTIRFLNLFPMLAKALLEGRTILIDEFDASIHPMALMNLINIFHNDEINTKGAQLIFNTHNPIFLSSSIFRRDEIKFVERSDDGESTIYSLADFGTSGSNAVRTTTDYMKNYFVNKYGAIKDVDFTDFFIANQDTTNEKGN